MSRLQKVGLAAVVLGLVAAAVSQWLRAEGHATEADVARDSIEVLRVADSTRTVEVAERERQWRAANDALREAYTAQLDSAREATTEAQGRYADAVVATNARGSELDSALARLADEQPEVGAPILALRRAERAEQAVERYEHDEVVAGLLRQVEAEAKLRVAAEGDATSYMRERDQLRGELATTRAALAAADEATERWRRAANPPLVLRIGKNLDLVLPAAGVGLVAGMLAAGG